jgi:hypothetical protein
MNALKYLIVLLMCLSITTSVSSARPQYEGVQDGPVSITGTTYYISNSLGNDAWSGALPEPNPGGTDGPKQSVDAATSLINAALPGDHILFRRGDVWNSNISVHPTGTEQAPIVLGAYGDGNLPTFDYVGTGRVLSVTGDTTAYMRFENLHLTTSGAPGNRPIGIFLYDGDPLTYPHHITFSGLLIDNTMHGITAYSNYLTIENSTIRNNYKIPAAGEDGHSQGAYFAGDHLVLRNNVFENNGKIDSWFDHHIYLSHISDVLIEGNDIGVGPDGIKVRSCHDVIIRGNHMHDTVWAGTSAGGDIDGQGHHNNSSNVLIEGNRMHRLSSAIVISDQSGGSSLATEGITIRNNLIYDWYHTPDMAGDWAGMLTITSSPVENVSIYNNVIWGDSNATMVEISNATMAASLLKNNVIHTTNDSIPLVRISPGALANMDLDHNLYYRTDGGTLIKDRDGSGSYTSLSAFHVDYPTQEVHGQEGNPNLQDPAGEDFHLTSASALAIDGGAVVTTEPVTDFDGVIRPSSGAWDIGAYEFVPSLTLHGMPADQSIHLGWAVNITIPVTATWQITYIGPPGALPSPITGIFHDTRTYTLTGMTNYTPYTVTLNGMVADSPFLTDTVSVIPTDIALYLPVGARGP